jgi:transglutaminase-like putative cysteine protease
MTGNALRLHVKHRTEITYAGQVRESINEARMLPVDGPRMRVEHMQVDVMPDAEVFTHVDVYGNLVAWFQIPDPHQRLIVESVGIVNSCDPAPLEESLSPAAQWDLIGDPVFTDTNAEYLGRTRHAAWGPRVAALAEMLPRPLAIRGRGVRAWADELATAIHAAVAYVPGSTLVDTPVEVVASDRRGVCQDLAHLMIAICRRDGVPARYVSGWLHDPARGVPGESHAWVEVLVPGAGWFEVDPTHPEPITGRWVRVATGRDYADVTPLRGTYQGAPTEKMSVTVMTEPALGDPIPA